ncbi:MAG TPA: hypothetical protein VNJ01_09535 [Bacteriovoracaceae bacterium]|nr:hypothetical protein [Bacteriovoracaceae bacterium]
MKSNKTAVLLALSMSLAGSCGKSGGGSSKSPNPQQETVQDLAQAPEGSYRSIIRPFNTKLNGWIPAGIADIKIVGDQVQVSLQLDDDGHVNHFQNIHIGTKCPTDKSDFNGDGMVDINEAYRVAGPALIPLDNDLDSQVGGGVFPMGSNREPGRFYRSVYNETGSYKKLMADLSTGTAGPSLAKLSSGDRINLAGKVIIIHGTEANTATPIPASVGTINNMPTHLSIPIACGVITKD